MAAPAAAEEASANWRVDFVDGLNNRKKSRKRGLLVAVQGSSLAAVEAACMGQSYNRCLTARYAVKRLPAIGTLLAGIVEDLQRLREGEHSRGKLTARDDAAWPEYARRVSPLPPLTDGALTIDQAQELFKSLGGDGEDRGHPLAIGERLVLLVELAEEAFDIQEWELARHYVFAALPERVVVVLADPLGRLAPSPHIDDVFLTLNVPMPEPADVETPDARRRYRAGALASDVPAFEDQLGLERHFKALARLLLHRETGRLTLAIEGEWGSGKSSFMLFLDDQMIATVLARRKTPRSVTKAERSAADSARRLSKLRRAQREAVRDDLVVLHFNPWGYLETGQIWAGLAHRLTSELRDMLSRRERLVLGVRYARERKGAELAAAIATVIVAVLLVVVAAIQGVEFSSSGSGGIVYAGGLVLLALLFWRAARGTKPVVDWISERFRPRDHAGGMGYQQEVIEDLRFYADGVRGGREQCKMVVFIDDLDRCSDEQILEFMGAINLVLVSSGFYVVMGIDTRMITDAVRARYDGREIDGGEEGIGESYLRKIVQIVYRVPIADAAQRYGSVRRLFSPAAQREHEERRRKPESHNGAEGAGTLRVKLDREHPGRPQDAPDTPVIEQPVEDTADELEAFRDFQTLLPENPRELKRMVNVHRLAKMLLQTEEMAWPPEQQRLCALWLVVCFRWPSAVRDLLAEQAPIAQDQSPTIFELLGSRLPTTAEQALLDEPLEELNQRGWHKPTVDDVRNLGLDSVVELCGVLPHRAAPTGRSGDSPAKLVISSNAGAATVPP